MKKLFAVWAVALGAMLSATPASAITVTFTPSSQHINVGDTATVDVFISGLGSEILSAVDINFLFTGGAAVWSVGTFGGLDAALGSPDSFFSFDSISGSNVGIQAYSLLDDATLAALQADSFLLGTWTLQGMADGVTFISFGTDPDFERNFVGLDALSLAIDLGTACIAVGTGECRTAVPEPGTLALLGLGILGMGLSRRRRAV